MKLVRITPVLGVADMGAALAFYQDVLGFSVAWEWGRPVSRVGIARGEIEIQLLSDSRLRPPGPSQTYIRITGLDDFYREVQKRGGRLKEPIRARDWGERDFRILDPSGNPTLLCRISFARLKARKHVRAVDPLPI